MKRKLSIHIYFFSFPFVEPIERSWPMTNFFYFSRCIYINLYYKKLTHFDKIFIYNVFRICYIIYIFVLYICFILRYIKRLSEINICQLLLFFLNFSIQKFQIQFCLKIKKKDFLLSVFVRFVVGFKGGRGTFLLLIKYHNF